MELTHYQKYKTSYQRYALEHRDERNASKRILNKKRIRYKGKQIFVGINPRSGTCSECNYKGITQMHHLKYDDENPLAHTIELCNSCHHKQHERVRDSKGRFIA